MTNRPEVTHIEELLGKELPVLDHGFIRIIDYMGDDAAIVQAARVSYGTGTKTIREDAGLINYLMKHSHTTPFEMCEIKFHIKLPIFVARQWIRHRTASVNEYSARYSILKDEFYIPTHEAMKPQSQTNRQGREERMPLDDSLHESYKNSILEHNRKAYSLYEYLLGDGDQIGMARELARGVLPLSTYTEWYWKIDLHNLFHFLKLRLDPHAQEEIRAYAKEIASAVSLWVPNAWWAFEEYELEGVKLSRSGVATLRKVLSGWYRTNWSQIDRLEIFKGVSTREREELLERFFRYGV